MVASESIRSGYLQVLKKGSYITQNLMSILRSCVIKQHKPTKPNHKKAMFSACRVSNEQVSLTSSQAEQLLNPEPIVDTDIIPPTDDDEAHRRDRERKYTV